MRSSGCAAALVAAVLSPASAQELETRAGARYEAPYDDARGVRTYADMVADASRSVVRVRAFRRSDSNEGDVVVTGAGVVTDAEAGLILTSAHVVERAAIITITNPDGEETDAVLLGADESTDLALLRADVGAARTARFADSELVRPGDVVFALGFPRALDLTITSGIVSGVARQRFRASMGDTRGLDEFIQTDAAMHPGNSGGPLIDSAGRVIGINTFILSESGDDSGLNFAAPSRFAVAVARQLERYGAARRGVIGVRVDTLRSDSAQALGVDVASGAVVLEVSPNSPAEAAGFRAGDVVTGAGGERIDSRTDFINFWLLAEPGRRYDVFARRGDQVLQLSLVLDAAEDAAPVAEADAIEQRDYIMGALFVDLPRRLDVAEPAVTGVRAAVVPEGSLAHQLGLRTNDIVVALDRASVTSTRGFRDALIASAPVPVALSVQRGGDREFIVLAPSDGLRLR